jgi:hypothetical protein
MSDRVNPFADLKDTPVFTTKPRAAKPVEEETIARIAEENRFPSRQAAKTAKAERRKPRTHRTGRNVQLNSKVTAETFARIYKAADDRGVVLGELLRLAMDALEREGTGRGAVKPPQDFRSEDS